MQNNYLTAIIFCEKKEGLNQGQFLKFHNVKNSISKMGHFCAFAKKHFASALYVNFYNKDRSFNQRIYL